MQKIAADNVPCLVQAAAVGNLNYRRVRVGVQVGRDGIRRIDADIMARKFFDQFSARRHRPIFDMRRQPVRISQNKFLVRLRARRNPPRKPGRR